MPHRGHVTHAKATELQILLNCGLLSMKSLLCCFSFPKELLRQLLWFVQDLELLSELMLRVRSIKYSPPR